MYSVRVHRDALKVYRRLDKNLQMKIDDAVEKLAADPFRRDLDIKRLHGEFAGYCRLRIGDLRLVYFVDTEQRLVFIDGLSFRGGAYK